jgi:hypothetical protein
MTHKPEGYRLTFSIIASEQLVIVDLRPQHDASSHVLHQRGPIVRRVLLLK